MFLGNSNNSKGNSCDFIPISFISKDLDRINFSKIFNDIEVNKLFPSKKLSSKYCKDDFSFSCSFRQNKSIRHNICNYRPNILKIDDLMIDNIDNVESHCHLYSDYVNRTVGHVITGDVNIVSNRKLRDVFKKGFNYIESTFKNKFEIIKSLKKDIIDYIYVDFLISIVLMYDFWWMERYSI